MANVPLGYRFHPTKEELIYYLFCFVSKKPLPCGVIPVNDLYGKEPWEICRSNCHETEYFFTPLKKATKGSRFARTVGTGKGTWSGKSKIEKISNRRNQIIGYSKDLRYQNKGSLDDGLWLMREYSLGESLKRHAKDEYKEHVLVRIRRKGSENQPGSDDLPMCPSIQNTIESQVDRNESSSQNPETESILESQVEVDESASVNARSEAAACSRDTITQGEFFSWAAMLDDRLCLTTSLDDFGGVTQEVLSF